MMQIDMSIRVMRIEKHGHSHDAKKSNEHSHVSVVIRMVQINTDIRNANANFA
jgi:hypothetical protein